MPVGGEVGLAVVGGKVGWAVLVGSFGEAVVGDVVGGDVGA
jgi:hypothetical protein